MATKVFKLACLATALVCAALFLLLLFSANTYIQLYGVSGHDSADFLGRRAAPVFLGIAVMSWMLREAGPSAARSAVCYGLGLAFIGIAITGLFEYGRGVASWTIGVAALSEILLGALFLIAARAK